MFSSSLKKPSSIKPYKVKFFKNGPVELLPLVASVATDTELVSVTSLLPDGNTVPPPSVFASNPLSGVVFKVVPSDVVPSLLPNTLVNNVENVEASSGVNVSVSPTNPENEPPVGV